MINVFCVDIYSFVIPMFSVEMEKSKKLVPNIYLFKSNLRIVSCINIFRSTYRQLHVFCFSLCNCYGRSEQV